MNPLRNVASGLMLLSGVTHTAQFLFSPPGYANNPVVPAFGVAFFVIGVVLRRPGALGLWLGAIVAGLGGLLGGLLAVLIPEPVPILHATISLLCVYLLLARRNRGLALAGVTIVLFGGGLSVALLYSALLPDPFSQTYADNCSQCHGMKLDGTAIGPPLLGRDLVHGSSVVDLAKSISVGSPGTGMPAWSETMTETQIRGMALLISEMRADFSYLDFNVHTPLTIPAGVIKSERHDFRIQTVAAGLDPHPFSIVPLPDGRILLVEKTRGLTLIGTDGVQSELIEGTPPTHDDGMRLPPQRFLHGNGWMMDVALHPDYEQNGWIYLHFGDRCADCGESMNKLIRGRIQGGQWIDEEVIWQADPATYTITQDTAAGGRITFDGEGHVFISVGIKGLSNYYGVQDLGLPYGKIHRVHDNGEIPSDNPFVDFDGALPSTWTYGHRSPQGLEFDPVTGRLWSTEMGPRGGDEFNLLLPGRNYGWPLYSLGLDYDGTTVEYGYELAIELDLSAIEQPVVDMTPSPAVASFTLYRGSLFPEWANNAIVGTLKATQLYRWVIEGDKVVHQETLLDGLARIRDVETGPDGAVYLLLEHGSGGQIVRLVAE